MSFSGSVAVGWLRDIEDCRDLDRRERQQSGFLVGGLRWRRGERNLIGVVAGWLVGAGGAVAAATGGLVGGYPHLKMGANQVCRLPPTGERELGGGGIFYRICGSLQN